MLVRIGAFVSKTIDACWSIAVPFGQSTRGKTVKLASPSPRPVASFGGRKPANGSSGSRPVRGSKLRRVHVTCPVARSNATFTLTTKGLPSRLGFRRCRRQQREGRGTGVEIAWRQRTAPGDCGHQRIERDQSAIAGGLRKPAAEIERYWLWPEASFPPFAPAAFTRTRRCEIAVKSRTSDRITFVVPFVSTMSVGRSGDEVGNVTQSSFGVLEMLVASVPESPAALALTSVVV